MYNTSPNNITERSKPADSDIDDIILFPHNKNNPNTKKGQEKTTNHYGIQIYYVLYKKEGYLGSDKSLIELRSDVDLNPRRTREEAWPIIMLL